MGTVVPAVSGVGDVLECLLQDDIEERLDPECKPECLHHPGGPGEGEMRELFEGGSTYIYIYTPKLLGTLLPVIPLK